jgi:hypothetical protein
MRSTLRSAQFARFVLPATLLLVACGSPGSSSSTSATLATGRLPKS